MNKVYNTQSDISSKIFNFLSNNTPSLHKPQLKIKYIILSPISQVKFLIFYLTTLLPYINLN